MSGEKDQQCETDVPGRAGNPCSLCISIDMRPLWGR
ncbi:hypothetical protein SDC9_41211 [bioreactor metagenome]|uniref:Uncharacterized protein n=1 Tax=bioreactor metagenome TaxID=1076179 RepID=A0A644VUK8_9ZZZZ